MQTGFLENATLHPCKYSMIKQHCFLRFVGQKKSGSGLLGDLLARDDNDSQSWPVDSGGPATKPNTNQQHPGRTPLQWSDVS